MTPFSQDIDALIIPGGFAPDYWRRDKRFVDLVKTTFDLGTQAVFYNLCVQGGQLALQGKPVAAICHGPWMLCSARILKDKKATCFVSIKDDVINAG